MSRVSPWFQRQARARALGGTVVRPFDWRTEVQRDPAQREQWLRQAIAQCRALAAREAQGGPLVREDEEFGPAFQQLLSAAGWRWVHLPQSVFRLAHHGDAGLPDYVCTHPAWHRLAIPELKSTRGRLSAVQVEWFHGLLGSGAEAYVFRPADVEDYVRVLGRREPPAREWIEERLRTLLAPKRPTKPAAA